MRPRHRLTFRNSRYSIAEAPPAFKVNPLGRWLGGPLTTGDFSRPFYWTTWVLTWCLPPVVLARCLRRKDRFVIAVGGIFAILTPATRSV